MAALLVMAAIPPAQAQNPLPRPISFTTGMPANVGADGFLDPEREVAEVPLTLRVGCTSDEAAVQSIMVKVEVKEKPTFGSAVVSPVIKQFQIDPAKCADTNYRQVVATTLIFQVTRDAPALANVTVKLEATLTEQRPNGQTTLGPLGASTNFTINYLALTNIVPAQYFQKAPQGAKIAFPIEVYNIGNGQSRVSFSLIALGKNRLPVLVTPPTLELESRAQKSSAALYKKHVHVLGETPSGDLYTNSIYSFQVLVKTESADPRGTATDETAVTLSVQVQGTAGGAPFPSVTFVFVLFALSALVGRRRR